MLSRHYSLLFALLCQRHEVGLRRQFLYLRHSWAVLVTWDVDADADVDVEEEKDGGWMEDGG